LRGSPTIVKKVFAPQPRAQKAELIELGDNPGEALIEALFQRQPKLEGELEKLARGY
jgi:electron transfer flavoprotein beta subunit